MFSQTCFSKKIRFIEKELWLLAQIGIDVKKVDLEIRQGN
jgi:hypothetical protein